MHSSMMRLTMHTIALQPYLEQTGQTETSRSAGSDQEIRKAGTYVAIKLNPSVAETTAKRVLTYAHENAPVRPDF
jgi:hypothetical protein